MSSGKKISDLRVVDLRNELDKRGLEKSGVKGVLIERLTQALLKEGLNPDDFIMEGSPTKQSSMSSKQDSEGESVPTEPKVRVKVEPPLIELDDDDGHPNMLSGYEGGDSNEKDGGNADPLADVSSKQTIKEQGSVQDAAKEPEDQGDSLSKEPTSTHEKSEVGRRSDNLVDQNEELDEAGGDEGADVADPEGEENIGDKPDGEQGGEDIEGGGDAGGTVEESLENENSGNGEDEREEEKMEEDEDAEDKNDGQVEKQTAKDETIDDEMDQDALHLTIGEDEEEDKNYILAEERDKDKPEEETQDPQNDAKTSKNSEEPSKKGKVPANSKKTSTTSLKTTGKSQKNVKGKTALTRPPANRGKTTNALKDKLNQPKPAGDTGRKTESKTTTVAKEKLPKEKPAFSSNAQRGKGRMQKGREAMKDNKGLFREGTPNRHFDRRIVLKTNRPPRPFEKHRIVPGRPKRRSMSPRHRRADISHRQTLSFDHIREMRERERQREREREMHRRLRERERREREELARQREIERRNAEELALLERERQRLRIEREKVEREKEELIRMEKERQRAERERIEREKEEIRRAKIEDRSSHRNQKRSFEEERELVSPRDYKERKKVAVPEPPRRHERTYPEVGHSAPRTHGPAVSTDRRGSDNGRHESERGHRRRGRSRSFSPVRDTREIATSRASRQHFAEREIAPRDWSVAEVVRETHRREKEVPKEKRTEERRDVRIARDRDIAIAHTSSRGASQADYSASSRNDVGQHHRGNAGSSSGVRVRSGADRYDMSKNDNSFSATREDHIRRAAYGIATNAPVSASIMSSSLQRDSWTDRSKDWQISDSRVNMRPSINEIPDRWITGSGSTISSGARVSISHVAQIVPAPPSYNQHASVISGGNVPSQTYSNDRYGAYNTKPQFRRY